MFAHVQTQNITSWRRGNFTFLAGGNEFEDEKCMYGNVSFQDTNIYYLHIYLIYVNSFPVSLKTNLLP